MKTNINQNVGLQCFIQVGGKSIGFAFIVIKVKVY